MKSIKSIKQAIEWRVRAWVGNEKLDGWILKASFFWRRCLKKTLFIGIVGSIGKTTTKELLMAILCGRNTVVGTRGSLNAAPEVAKVILRSRPWHDFGVLELAEHQPNALDVPLALLSPSIVVITNIGDDHISAFGSRQAIAKEVIKAVKAVPPAGSVLLNADDELAIWMRGEANCHVLTFGVSANADLRALEIKSTWPGPLCFMAIYKGHAVSVQTQLYGRQLLTSVLAAIGCGLAAGLTLEECAVGIQAVPPAEGRMQLVRCAGVTFVRDDFKAPYWTLESLIEQVADAQVSRKIFVLGTISDTQKKEEAVVRTAEKILEVADIAILVGRFATAGLKLRNSANRDKLFVFTRVRDACDFIHSIHREGDLIVLKGNWRKDHLDRIPMSFSGKVNCWVDDCDRQMFCRECSHLLKHRGSSSVNAMIDAYQDTQALAEKLPRLEEWEQVVIGLGNPGVDYEDTPHNVGYGVLDVFAKELSVTWREYPDAWVARGKVIRKDGSSRSFCLIKINSPMNLIGRKLAVLAGAMAFGPEQCILVYDDIDYPIGKVKMRMNGSSGGHRGVASILEAFQSDKIRRIKIGVSDETSELAQSEMVIRKFSPENLEKIKPSILLATKRLLEMI